jgi:hypothetical protein
MPVLGPEMLRLIHQADPQERPKVLRLVCGALRNDKGLYMLHQLVLAKDARKSLTVYDRLVSRTYDEVRSAPLVAILNLFYRDEATGKIVLHVPREYIDQLVSEEVAGEISSSIRSWWPEDTVRAKHSRKIADMIDEGHLQIKE